jgi:hypothetical protein
MCCETDGGMVELFGRIRIRPNKFEPIVLPELKYIVFKDTNNILGLNYRAVCIDFEIEAEGKTVDEAFDGLKKAINHYIDLAIKDFKREKAYTILMEERRTKLLSGDIACMSYYQAEAHRYIHINEEIKHRVRLMSIPYYLDLLNRLISMVPFRKIYASRTEAL